MMRLLLLASILFGVASATHAQTWYESYGDAEAAVDRGEWSQALDFLHQAMEARPNSGARQRTYGMRFVDYYPYLKLGIVYFQLGQLDAAFQALETEERLGAIQSSREASAQLEEYRTKISDERRLRIEQQAQRAVDQTAQSIAAARSLHDQGKLVEALTQLDRALVLDPLNVDATALQQTLRSSLAESQRTAARERRLSTLADSGRAALAAGDLETAAARFAEALNLRDDRELRKLSDQARAQLRQRVLDAQRAERLQQAETTTEVPTAITSSAREALNEAEQELKSGEREKALLAVQRALALEPTNQEARQLQSQLVALDLESDRLDQQAALIENLHAQAVTHAAALRNDQALRFTHQVLALDPDHAGALRLTTQIYQRLSSMLSGAGEAPPIVVFADASLADSEFDQLAKVPELVIRSRRIVLAGTVYSNGPVDIVISPANANDLSKGALGELEISTHQARGISVTDFTWTHRLKGDRREFRLEASGDGPLAATQDFSYRYLPPWYLTPWSFLAAILSVAGLVTICLMVKRKRRRKLLFTRFNPYVAGSPILEESRFFGRKQLLDYVLRRIPNNSIMLYGERRIGKTSFQHQLKRELTTLNDPDHEFYPVYIDLQGTPQDRFFATVAGEIFHELGPRMPGIRPTVAPSRDDYTYRDLVKDVGGVLKVLRESTSKKAKLVLLIDEVDELNDYDPRINQRLRSLFMRAFAENLATVVSGVSIKKHWEREGSPWYNFFQEIEVKPLDLAAAQSLIEAPVKGVFNFDKQVTEEIIRRTNSKPYLIQRLCATLIDRLHEERRTRITMDDVSIGCQTEGL